MTDDEAKYVTPDEAASRLGKSASQVRRDAQSHRINSMRDGGRIWIRVDERFRALEQNPSQQFPEDLEAREPGNEGRSGDGGQPDARTPRSDLTAELIDEIAELRAELARLTARVRKIEARS